MTSKLKVEFIDNSSSQYDQNASIIKYNQNGIVEGINKKLGRLYLGACSLYDDMTLRFSLYNFMTLRYSLYDEVTLRYSL